jgi:hypothetical protein
LTELFALGSDFLFLLFNSLTVGSANGKLAELFTGVNKINTNYGPFDLLLCAGDLFGEDNPGLEALISGEIKGMNPDLFVYVITQYLSFCA